MCVTLIQLTNRILSLATITNAEAHTDTHTVSMEHGTRWIDEHYTFTPITIKLFNCLFVRVCECLCVCSNLNHRRTVDMDNINQLENCGTRQHSKKNALSPGEFSSPPQKTQNGSYYMTKVLIVLFALSVSISTVSVFFNFSLFCCCWSSQIISDIVWIRSRRNTWEPFVGI